MNTRSLSIVGAAVAAWLGVGVGTRAIAVGPQPAPFDVADISYLWPVPKSAADVAALIPSDMPTADGGPLLAKAAFDSILEAVKTTAVTDRAGLKNAISFDDAFADEMRTQTTWKVAGFRVDPAAIGHPETAGTFGVMPQLRLILQPVTVEGGRVTVHDFAAHLAFGYFTGSGPFAADRTKFQELVDDLVALKAASPAPTSGPLGVHPGLASRDAAFAAKVRRFAAKHTAPSRGRLFAISFMGLDPPEPWIFFALVGKPDGTFVAAPQRALGGGHAQMISFRGGVEIAPLSTGVNTGAAGKVVSTDTLFGTDAKTRLGEPAAPGLARPRRGETADLIANPKHAHVLNTDCVSCHTESTRRLALKLPAGDGTFRFARPSGASDVDPRVLPVGSWNVRNFGWFSTSATISQRAANEAAESLEALTREYLRATPPSPSGLQARLVRASLVEPVQAPPPIAMLPADPPKPTATPLTLVMDIKSPADFKALTALLQGMQSKPPDENPIRQALNRLRIVHYARFVFLSDKQLAIITTFDGSFEDYIDAFSNSSPCSVCFVQVSYCSVIEEVAGAPPEPGYDASKRTYVEPKLKMSPSDRRCSAAMRVPLTIVPFVEPRSLTT